MAKRYFSGLTKQGNRYCLYPDKLTPCIVYWNAGKNWNAIIETGKGTIPVIGKGEEAKAAAVDMLRRVETAKRVIITRNGVHFEQ